MTFIISSCLVTTKEELARMLVAGCRSLRTPCGSSATWTGDRREFLVGSALFKVDEIDSKELFFGSGGGGVGVCWSCGCGGGDVDDADGGLREAGGRDLGSRRLVLSDRDTTAVEDKGVYVF